MKQSILFRFLARLLGLSLMAVTAAHADTVCNSVDGKSYLELHPVTNQRLDAQVWLNKNGTEILFGARLLPDSDGGFLYKKDEYELYGYQQGETFLTVLARQSFGRGGCGRAGCDGEGSPTLTAKLIHQGTTTQFNCYEEVQ